MNLTAPVGVYYASRDSGVFLMRLAYLMRTGLAIATLVAVSTRAEAQVEPRPAKKGRKYSVRIDSAPQQAAIYLDDEKYGIVGYTPWAGKLEKGNWKVIVKKDGYELATRIITVKRSSRLQETFLPMTKRIDPGVIDVRGDADRNAIGAEVWVDGQMQGQIPVVVKVSAGRHLVEVKKTDFDSFSQWVEVKDGEKALVNPMLKGQARGSVLVDADVPDAEIFLDGNKHPDRTPSLIANVMEGPHVIEVRKEPAVPWRQTVQVEKDKTIKVTAALKTTMGGQGGNVRVLSNVEGADVFVDGTVVGKTPIDVKDIKPGDHLIEVRATGHMPKEERVTVNAGSATVLKLDLSKSAGDTVLKVVSPVPDSEVFIDGERLGLSPQQKSVAAGEHLVLVSKQGFAKFEKKVKVKEGEPQTVTAELRAAGGLRFVSTPGGATVLLDGEPIGQTPMVKEDVPVGEHMVSIQADGYYAFENGVKVQGGEIQLVKASLQKINTELSEEEKALIQRGLTTFGAKALPAGRSTMAFGAGYPYFFSTRFMVGVGKLTDQLQFDAGAQYRMYGARWELSVIGRATLVDSGPFALGTFVDTGGGSTFFDNSKRDYYFFNGGLMASLTGLGAATLTGRAYLNAWTDRHCPRLDGADFEVRDDDAPDICVEYLRGTIAPEDKSRVDRLLDGDGEIFNRDAGARLITSLAIEVALSDRWSLWGLFEGVPKQKERAAYTDIFHESMFERDPRSYVTIGLTVKF